MAVSFVRRLLVVASLSSPIACGLYGSHPADLDPPRGSSPPAVPSADEVEQVRLYIGEVPADVRCVRITAAGTGRTVERELEVTGGTALSESLSGLPIGTVTFIGEAFAAACSGVTKATVAPWASAPVQASIVLGRLTTVDLVMVRNGRAKVDVTFTEEAACTALGAACRVNSECCSKRCTAGACVVGGDAGTE
jgi:hypothetical protein